MNDNTILPFSFPAVARKKVTADFDGSRLTSDGGVMLLAVAERRLGIAERLARMFPDRRDPTRITHTLADMIRARVFAICCGYADADDLDFLRTDPAFKLACGRLPDTGLDLCSQPTLSRLENAPCLKDVIRLTYALVDAWMDSYEREPASVTLDIDDTCDVAHGQQQLSLFDGHYDERCFLPIHVYDPDRSRPVAVVLRPGQTPGGVEVRAHLRRLVRHNLSNDARKGLAILSLSKAEPIAHLADREGLSPHYSAPLPSRRAFQRFGVTDFRFPRRANMPIRRPRCASVRGGKCLGLIGRIRFFGAPSR